MARTFIFQRSADAVREGDDRYRVLTEKGLAQAASVQQKLKERSLAPSDVRFSSHALRNVQTILPDGGDCHLLEALDIPMEEIAKASVGLEYADPQKFLEGMGPFFRRLAARATDRMSPLLPRQGIVRVVGHLTFVNFLALHFCGDTVHLADRRLIVETFLNEGSCIILWHDGKVEILDP